MTTDRAAKQKLGVKPKTLESWRLAGQPPKTHKVGRKVRYLLGDVRLFVAQGGAK